MTPRPDDPRLLAAVDLIRRTGAATYRAGYTDDGDPVVWYACAAYPDGRAEAAAGMNPYDATMRLAELLVDGGLCRHCGQRTILDPDPFDPLVDPLLDSMGCRYVFDPVRATFRRSCE